MADTGNDGDPAAGMPRWVKVFGIIAAVVILLLIIILLIGGGKHGPSRHTGGLGGLIATSSAAGHGPNQSWS